MWFKVFVLLRFPISAFCLVGCAILLLGDGAFGGVLFFGMLAFLVFVSIRLVQFREDTPGLAVWLLLLELVGGVVIMAGENYFGFREFNLLFWASTAVIVGLFWTLPNALVLYSQRAKFTEPAKEKPGL
jgi:hypothetical protein